MAHEHLYIISWDKVALLVGKYGVLLAIEVCRLFKNGPRLTRVVFLLSWRTRLNQEIDHLVELYTYLALLLQCTHQIPRPLRDQAGFPFRFLLLALKSLMFKCWSCGVELENTITSAAWATIIVCSSGIDGPSPCNEQSLSL